MTVRVHELHYPLLCLTREMGVCIAKSASEFGRCRAVVYWRGKFYEDLRVVDASGKTHEIVGAKILKPVSRLGQRVARFLDLPIHMEVQARRSTPLSLAEVSQAIEKAVDEDAESFEAFSGNSVEWWRRSLAECKNIADLMRTLHGAKA